MSASISGWNGTVKSGATDLDVEGWSADFKIVEVDTTTTADAGWEDTAPGVKSVEGSFDFNYVVANKPTGSGANLTMGNTVALTLTVTTGETFTGNALITKLSIKNKVKDTVKVTASFKNKGVWVLPS